MIYLLERVIYYYFDFIWNAYCYRILQQSFMFKQSKYFMFFKLLFDSKEIK